MILMINNEFPPIGGGSATVNLRLFEQWDDSTIPLYLITCDLPASSAHQKFNQNITIQPLVSIKIKNKHHSTIFELLHFAIRSYFACRKICSNQKPRALFAWSTVPSGLITALLSFQYKIPFIVRVSGPDIPGFENRYTLLYPFLRPLLKTIWTRAHTVITKCHYEADAIRIEAPQANIVIIPNGTVLHSETTPKEFQINKEALTIVCVSRLIERKGINLLLKAVSALKQENFKIKLSIVGTGDEEEALKHLSSTLQTDDCVNFYGAIDRSEINTHYKNAHVFALTSHNEGMSIATLEAIGHGLPCIVTDTGGARDIVTDGYNGFIIPKDSIQETISALKKLFQESELVNKFSKNSITRANELSWENIYLKYQKLLTSI